MNVAPFRTSELWLAILGGVLGVLVSAGVLDAATAGVVKMAIVGLATVIAQRIVHKAVNGRVAFVHPSKQ